MMTHFPLPGDDGDESASKASSSLVGSGLFGSLIGNFIRGYTLPVSAAIEAMPEGPSAREGKVELACIPMSCLICVLQSRTRPARQQRAAQTM